MSAAPAPAPGGRSGREAECSAEEDRDGGRQAAGGLAARRVCARECGRVPATLAFWIREEIQPVRSQPRGPDAPPPPPQSWDGQRTHSEPYLHTIRFNAGTIGQVPVPGSRTWN